MSAVEWKGNLGKMNKISVDNWKKVREWKLAAITAEPAGRFLVDESGHRFINMVSCDYLGISSFPCVINEIKKNAESKNIVNLSISSVRIKSKLLEEVEDGLERLFKAKCLVSLSASEAAAAFIPLLASGYFHEGKRPVIVFDKQSHFSLKYIAPVAKNETLVLEINKSDISSLEDVCKKFQNVAYITDSVYSLGGFSPQEKIKELQDRYNLCVCYDEAHSISIFGEKGEGLIRPLYESLPSNVFILASFNKAFGAAGGGVIMSEYWDKEEVRAIAGPFGWSQCISDPILAAIKGALSVHLSGKIYRLQEKLLENIQIFDKRVESSQKGLLVPIRVIETKTMEDTLSIARSLYERGFYLAPLFFPIVPQGKFGLRVMLRSDLKEDDIERLSIVLDEVICD